MGLVATIRSLLWCSSHHWWKVSHYWWTPVCYYERTNRVSTFDEENQTWKSYYPDLLTVRSGPGVVSHLEHVIVAGGTRALSKNSNRRVAQDDIEVLNWIENSHWRMVHIRLPVPMFGFTPTISDDRLLIVGYHVANSACYNNAYT